MVRSKGGGKGANAAKTCLNCCESGHMSSQCPKKEVHAVEESTTGESGLAAKTQSWMYLVSEATSMLAA